MFVLNGIMGKLLLFFYTSVNLFRYDSNSTFMTCNDCNFFLIFISGLPVWLHNMPGIELRTANDVFMVITIYRL